MKSKVTLGLLILILMVSSASAFDNLRKGFVLGGGLGFTPSAKWSADVKTYYGVEKYDEDGTGIGYNLIIGYAWDEKNMIVYEGNIAAYKSDFFKVNVYQGFNGASWYHYFGQSGKSLFAAGGIGFYIFSGEGYRSNDLGPGLLVGLGYEFTPHAQVGLYFMGGKTSSAGVDFNHSQFSLLINGVAF